MNRFTNSERREDAPPDPTTQPQVLEPQQQQQQQRQERQRQQQQQQQPPPNIPPKDDPSRLDDPSRQLAPAERTPEDRERSRSNQRTAAAEDRGKQQQRAPGELLSEDRTRQRPNPVEDRGKQRAPAEVPPEDRDRTKQRPPAAEDRGRQRAPAELQQAPQYNERSPLFTPPPAAGPSRGYDAYSHRQPSPTESDDIVITDNRTQPRHQPQPQPQPQPKTGFWARFTGPARDRGEPESASARTRGRLPPQPSRPNVILFGERGAGKSSLINMLVGRDVSNPSDPGLATFASRGYAVDVGGREVVVWETVGLQKGEHHDALSEGAAKNLQGLIQNVHGGLNLLLYCVNAARASEALEVNYDAFFNIIGSKKVPVVLVVTGLENMDPMEGWWKEHEAEFKKHWLTFDGHACITTIRGKPLKDGPGHWHDEQYEQSRLAVKELIKAKLGTPIFVREEGKLAELRELLREQNGTAAGQNADKGKNGWILGETEGTREVNNGYGSTRDEQTDDDRGDRVEREGRTASLALLGGLFAVFVFLHSGVISCF